MASIARRVHALEARVTPAAGRLSAREVRRRFDENADIIAGTMDPTHLAHVINDVEELGEHVWEQGSPLTLAVLHAINRASVRDWAPGELPPLSMPPAVAQVWLDDPEASAIDSCRDCRFALPARSYYERGAVGFRPAVSYFHVCPVCGSGNVHRIEDSEGVVYSNRDGCYYRAGRRVDPTHA